MLQETSTWDLQRMGPALSPVFRLYIVFLFAVCILASSKLIKLWRAAPPFRVERQEKNLVYFRTLEMVATSLRQWITCTFLAWGIVASVDVYDCSNRLLGQEGVDRNVVLFAIEGLSSGLTMALLVVLCLVLIRWHVLKRIEHCRRVARQDA